MERPKLAAKSGCIAVYIGFESVANEGDNYKKNNVVFEQTGDSKTSRQRQ